MTKEVQCSNDETDHQCGFIISISAFLRHSTFVIWHYSWRQSINLPRTIGLSRVTKAIVQTVRTTLPEFHRIRFKPITAPVRRRWNRLVAEALGHLCHARIEHATCVDYLALTRRPGAQLAAHWARMKISLRFLTRGFRHFSADANLPVQFDPVKPQRRIRIGLELLSFFALVIGKKNEAVVVEAFQQNNPH